MHPDSRSIHRFFQGLNEVCPVSQLGHLHLIHWPTDPPSPLDTLREAGFNGTVVVARASLADAIRHYHPDVTTLLDDHPTGGQPSDHILMELPQGKEAARWTIQAALAALNPTGRLWLFGERESGIHSLSKRFSQVETVLCKGHLRLVSLASDSVPLPEPGKTNPFIPDTDGFAYVTANKLKIAVKPGVFSWQAIDPATRLLLDVLQDHPGPRLLDWGCGSGFLGVALATRFPDIHVVLSDDLVTATRCALRSVEQNGLSTRCEVITEDGIGKKLEKLRFDTIVTNPPFHRGVRTNHNATRTFLATVASCLNPGGALWLVGNRFMDYETLIKERFTQVDEMDGDDAFTVWRGIKSKTSAQRQDKKRKETTRKGQSDDQWLTLGPGEDGLDAMQRQIKEWTKKI